MTWKLLPLVVVAFMGLASEAQAQDTQCKECRSRREVCEETGEYFQRYYCAPVTTFPGWATCTPTNTFSETGCTGSCTESGDCEVEPGVISVTSNGAPLLAWRSGVQDLIQRGACRRA